MFVTAAELASHVGGTATDAQTVRVVAAVNDYLSGLDWLTRPDPAGIEQPTATAKLGALMLAARLHRRRNSLGGLEPLADGGAAYVARTDPDVARLLGIDGYAPPIPG